MLRSEVLSLPESEKNWWGVWILRFLRECRESNHFVESKLADAFAGYLRSLDADHSLQSWQREQASQALKVYERGIENWNWKEKRPRFRVRTRLSEEAATEHSGDSPEHPESPVPSRSAKDKPRNPCDEADNTADSHRFLEKIAVKNRVTASTQNQAFSALLFLHRNLWNCELDGNPNTLRARRGKKLPSVLSAGEVRNLLAHMEGTSGLIARVLYGAGLRVRLRVTTNWKRLRSTFT